jgi:hypothetical protein
MKRGAMTAFFAIDGTSIVFLNPAPISSCNPISFGNALRI